MRSLAYILHHPNHSKTPKTSHKSIVAVFLCIRTTFTNKQLKKAVYRSFSTTVKVSFQFLEKMERLRDAPKSIPGLNKICLSPPKSSLSY
jgi:UV DNA damage repair endonuclease